MSKNLEVSKINSTFAPCFAPDGDVGAGTDADSE